MLKRLETAQLVRRTRNPDNERQVVISLTAQSRALESRAGCLGERLLEVSGRSARELAELNASIRRLRDAIYSDIGGDPQE